MKLMLEATVHVTQLVYKTRSIFKKLQNYIFSLFQFYIITRAENTTGR